MILIAVIGQPLGICFQDGNRVQGVIFTGQQGTDFVEYKPGNMFG